MDRPDLSTVSPEVLAYILHLEDRLRVRVSQKPVETSASDAHEHQDKVLVNEPETTVSVFTLTEAGLGKRTYRHLYARQHRGGIGVFGIDLDQADAPTQLAITPEAGNVLVFTNRARVFRQTSASLASSSVLSKGQPWPERVALEPDERIVTILPEQARGYIALGSASGRLRILRHHLFGEHMRPGMNVFNINEFGLLTCACWTQGDDELFLATRGGMAIRFSEKALAPQGETGIKLSGDDVPVAICPVRPESSVFLLGADGRGTTRLMSGFAANKSPGGSGKIAFKNAQIIGACAVEPDDDILAITRSGKVIRFPVEEVPPSEGIVQGVFCMSLRADEVVAMARCSSSEY